MVESVIILGPLVAGLLIGVILTFLLLRSSMNRIFVNSMSDLFHEDIADEYVKECFQIMEKADWHVYQILTKRPERMLEFSRHYGRIPGHIWLGTSVEMSLYKKRIDVLRKVRVRTRFISFEPLLGPIGRVNLRGISWVIVGGESGPNHRLIEKKWVLHLRNQCLAKGVPFFFKQWGGTTAKSGGRSLDGKHWSDYPESISHTSKTRISQRMVPNSRPGRTGKP